MKNKLRAIANWILILAIPIWFIFFVLWCFLKAILFEKDEVQKKRNRGEFKETFIEGKDWFWE